MKTQVVMGLDFDVHAPNMQDAIGINADTLAASICTAKWISDNYGMRADQSLFLMLESQKITYQDIFAFASIYAATQMELLNNTGGGH